MEGGTVHTKLYQLKQFLSWAGPEAEALVKRVKLSDNVAITARLPNRT